MSGAPNENAPDAILSRDVGSRLDAIVRRHGGTPKGGTSPSAGPKFAPVGRFKIEQDGLFDAPEEQQ